MLNKDALQKIRIQALKEKNKVLKGTSSIILGEIDLKEKGTGEVLSEKDIVEMIVKSIKTAKDNLEIFKNRKDETNADLTSEEIKSLEYILTFNSGYKPALTESEIIEIVKSNGSGMGDMGKVMSHLKTNYLGRYDAGEVSKLVRETLQNG